MPTQRLLLLPLPVSCQSYSEQYWMLVNKHHSKYRTEKQHNDHIIKNWHIKQLFPVFINRLRPLTIFLLSFKLFSSIRHKTIRTFYDHLWKYAYYYNYYTPSPMPSLAASKIIFGNLARFSMLPPNTSVRWLVQGEINCWILNPCPPCINTPSNPQALAKRAIFDNHYRSSPSSLHSVRVPEPHPHVHMHPVTTDHMVKVSSLIKAVKPPSAKHLHLQ